jgi:hypothetical protein
VHPTWEYHCCDLSCIEEHCDYRSYKETISDYSCNTLTVFFILEAMMMIGLQKRNKGKSLIDLQAMLAPTILLQL